LMRGACCSRLEVMRVRFLEHHCSEAAVFEEFVSAEGLLQSRSVWAKSMGVHVRGSGKEGEKGRRRPLVGETLVLCR
jgi:hypothetical protein